MRIEVDPNETSRGEAFSQWMLSPQPMVTFVKTIDVSRLRKKSRKTGMKFNVLLCWCMAKAASQIEEFYLLPQGDKLYRYDRLAVNVIVANRKGGISLCDVPFSEDIHEFNADYLEITGKTAESCETTSLDEYMILGTSAILYTELDSVINQYTGKYNNPYVAWGKYRKGFWKTTLPVSIQFHHAQMDGSQACQFLNLLQEEIFHFA